MRRLGWVVGSLAVLVCCASCAPTAREASRRQVFKPSHRSASADLGSAALLEGPSNTKLRETLNENRMRASWTVETRVLPPDSMSLIELSRLTCPANQRALVVRLRFRDGSIVPWHEVWCGGMEVSSDHDGVAFFHGMPRDSLGMSVEFGGSPFAVWVHPGEVKLIEVRIPGPFMAH